MLFQIATLVLATAPVLAYTAAFEVTVKDGYFYRFPGAAVNGTNAGGNGQVKSGESQTFYTEQDGVPEFRDFVLSKEYEVYSVSHTTNHLWGSQPRRAEYEEGGSADELVPHRRRGGGGYPIEGKACSHLWY